MFRALPLRPASSWGRECVREKLMQLFSMFFSGLIIPACWIDGTQHALELVRRDCVLVKQPLYEVERMIATYAPKTQNPRP